MLTNIVRRSEFIRKVGTVYLSFSARLPLPLAFQVDLEAVGDQSAAATLRKARKQLSHPAVPEMKIRTNMPVHITRRQANQ